MCVVLLFTLPPLPLVTCLHESHPASVLRPPLKARQKVASEWLPGRHSQGFVPHLRRRPNAAAPRAPRAPLHAVSARGRRCLQDYRLTQRACPGTQSPGRPFLLASAPQPRAYSGRSCRRRAFNGRPPLRIEFSRVRARSGLLQHRLCVRLLPALPCRGLSKNPWTLATGWSWGGIQLSRGAPPTTPLGRGAALAAASPNP